MTSRSPFEPLNLLLKKTLEAGLPIPATVIVSSKDYQAMCQYLEDKGILAYTSASPVQGLHFGGINVTQSCTGVDGEPRWPLRDG